MRSRFSYANVTATLALFFAMSGGALAAKHYLISSTNQISPRVLKALKGNAGKQGPVGAAGAKGETGLKGDQGLKGETGLKGERGLRGEQGEEGFEGLEGPEGPEGRYPTVLPTGQTESGAWGGGFTASGVAEYREVGSFPIPLPAALEASHVIYVSGALAEHCPGQGEAAKGYLCVYQELIENAETPTSSQIVDVDDSAKPAGAGIHGFEITLKSKGAGLTTVSGTFAVTAP